jgi:cytochrome c
MTRLLLIMVFVSLLTACGKAEQPAEQAPGTQSGESTAQAATLGGEELFVIACQGCHNISPGATHRVGPNLYGIVGQAAASAEGFQYSGALAQSDLTWTPANLAAWIVAAETVVPGTWMLYHNILEANEIAALVDYIEQASPPVQK